MNKYLLILLMLASANAVAAINKWVDTNDRVHYSDQPPPSDAKAKTIRSVYDTESATGASGVDATSAPAAPKSIAEREADLKKAQRAKKEAADKAAQKQAVTEADRANCDTAQKNLRALQDGIRMMEVNSDGVRSYLSDEQRQQRMEKSRQDVSKYCK